MQYKRPHGLNFEALNLFGASMKRKKKKRFPFATFNFGECFRHIFLRVDINYFGTEATEQGSLAQFSLSLKIKPCSPSDNMWFPMWLNVNYPANILRIYFNEDRKCLFLSYRLIFCSPRGLIVVLPLFRPPAIPIPISQRTAFSTWDLDKEGLFSEGTQAG